MTDQEIADSLSDAMRYAGQAAWIDCRNIGRNC